MPRRTPGSHRRRTATFAACLIVVPVVLLGAGAAPSSAADATAAGCTTILSLRLCSGRRQPPATVPPVTVTVPPLPPVTLPATTSTTTPPPAVHDVVDLVPQLLALMNADRAVAGLPAFSLRADLNALAQQHSRNMAAKHEIWHNDDYFAARSALAAGAMGQNVALNHSVPGAQLAFMASPHHRDNVLDGRFSVVGLGVTTDERGMFYVTQDFIQPKGTPRAVAARPARVSAPVAPRATSGTAKPQVTPKPPVVASGRGAAEPPEAEATMALPESRPRHEIAVPASSTFRLTPISGDRNDNTVAFLALVLLVAAAVPTAGKIRVAQEYAKVR